MTSKMIRVSHSTSPTTISNSIKLNNYNGLLTTLTHSLDKLLCLINSTKTIIILVFLHSHRWLQARNKYFNQMVYNFQLEHSRWWIFRQKDSNNKDKWIWLDDLAGLILFFPRNSTHEDNHQITLCIKWILSCNHNHFLLVSWMHSSRPSRVLR